MERDERDRRSSRRWQWIARVALAIVLLGLLGVLQGRLWAYVVLAACVVFALVELLVVAGERMRDGRSRR